MEVRLLGVMVGVVAAACAPAVREAGGGEAGLERSPAGVLARAQGCADELRRNGAFDLRVAATALRVEPRRLAAFRGTPAEVTEIRAAIEERLVEARANASAASSLTSVAAAGMAAPTALERMRTGSRAADDLCRAVAALRPTQPQERVANGP